MNIKLFGFTSMLAIMAIIGSAGAQTINSTGTGTATSGSQSGSASTATGIQNGGGTNIQSGNTNTNANSNARSSTRSNSNATTTAVGNSQRTSNGSASSLSITNNSDPPGSNGTTDPGGRPWGTWNGGDVTVRTTPTVYAPPVSGGNPCTLAVSGGVSVIGWGAAAGGTFVDQDCANRQKIAMIHNAGYQGAAKELMCNDRDTYYAFRTSGQPCAFRPQFEAAGSTPPPAMAVPTPVVAPLPQPVVAVPQKPLVRCNPARGIVDNCYSG
jgi:hypothetical protein